MNVVAVRIHKKDKRNGTGEQYYLGKVVGPLRQLKEGGCYEGNYYERGFFVFDMVWFHYQGTQELSGKNGKQTIGDRKYILGTATADHCTMQLNGVVTGVDAAVKFSKILTAKGKSKTFVLANADHECILLKGA